MITKHIRTAEALWEGTGLEGKGHVSTPSKAIENLPYSHKSRFENEDGLNGTNPEEMIAAAHAGCFNMALSFQLNGAGFTAKSLKTTATVLLDQEGHDYSIAKITLYLKGDVPGISEEVFGQLANVAKLNCPISQALNAVPIELKWSLV